MLDVEYSKFCERHSLVIELVEHDYIPDPIAHSIYCDINLWLTRFTV